MSWKHGWPNWTAPPPDGGPFAATCWIGLYAAPEFAGQGVGAGLLDMLEGLMRDRGFPSVHAEASPNARDFYLRRGYRATGPRTPKGAWPIAKELP